MSQMRNEGQMMTKKPTLWGAALAIALVSTAALANEVVVKSFGPSSKAYPPGKTIAPGGKIKLQGGDVVTVIGPSAARTLRGPGSFDAGEVSLEAAAAQRGRFGALRTEQIMHPPAIWDIDVTQSGKMCVADAKNLQLWRPDSDEPASVEIRSADGQVQKLDWAKGKALAAWPAALPVTTGGHYEIQGPHGGDPSTIDFVAVSSVPEDMPTTAQVLIENGCQNQLDLLVARASAK
jgi:hypothetical protein